jgi:hypothetical protein
MTFQGGSPGYRFYKLSITTIIKTAIGRLTWRLGGDAVTTAYSK